MDVRLVKLISGEEVIGEISKTEDGMYILLNNPIRFMATQQGVAIVPFNPLLAEEPLQIPRGAIMLIANLREEVITEYKSRFGGVIVPPTGLVLPD